MAAAAVPGVDSNPMGMHGGCNQWVHVGAWVHVRQACEARDPQGS